MRKLARIEVIDDLQPIKDADLIEVATILGWKVVVQKGKHKVGEKIVYFEIDSFLPIKPEYEFLRRESFQTMAGREGFALRTVRMRGQISQGLVMGTKELNISEDFKQGDDLTELLGVELYEKDVPDELLNFGKGYRPFIISSTELDRIQNMKLEDYAGLTFYEMEKLEGFSMTISCLKGQVSVCSKDVDLLDKEGSVYWRAAKQLDLVEGIKRFEGFALQGELVGPGIKKNPYKLSKLQFFPFRLFDTTSQQTCELSKLKAVSEMLGLETVPVLAHECVITENFEELLQKADGQSAINPAVRREGVVYRSHGENKDCREVAFKVISNKYLLKQK